MLECIYIDDVEGLKDNISDNNCKVIHIKKEVKE